MKFRTIVRLIGYADQSHVKAIVPTWDTQKLVYVNVRDLAGLVNPYSEFPIRVFALANLNAETNMGVGLEDFTKAPAPDASLL